MHERGLDFGLDVHGDEALPYNFIAGGEGCPCWNEGLAGLQKAWCDAQEAANPDFQQVQGYPIDAKGAANLAIGSNALCEAFGALVMTLEMPFKVRESMARGGEAKRDEREMLVVARSLTPTLTRPRPSPLSLLPRSLTRPLA